MSNGIGKMKSWDELRKIRESAKALTDMRVTGENKNRTVIAVGMATCGIAAGARDTLSALRDEIAAAKLENVSLVTTGCFGFCYAEPMVEVRVPETPPVRYGHVDTALAGEIVRRHLVKGELVDSAIISREVERP